jgi:type IV pilus assembly protein PilA
MGSKRQVKNKATLGLTLSEVMVTVAIAGTLSGITYPSFTKQLKIGCQNQQENAISQVMSSTQSFTDEYGSTPNGWSDLDKIATLMTVNGPAKGSSFASIDLPKCNYSLIGSQEGNEFAFEASRNNLDGLQDKFNVVGCINTATGASDLQRGNGSEEANAANLNCN